MSSEPANILPSSDDFLVLSPAQQVHAYRRVDDLFASRPIRAKEPKAMPRATVAMPENYSSKVANFVYQNNVAGLLVINDGQVMLERYALGLTERDRWTTMSTVKSMTSLLVGAAIEQQVIASVDSTVGEYLPEMRGTAYEQVTVKDLLTMSSGTAWTEDYNDLSSHVSQYSRLLASRTPRGVLELLKTLESIALPGTRWAYNTGDTYLIGALLVAATGIDLARFMQEQIWAPCGMEFDAFYTLESEDGLEIAGSRAGMALRDIGKVAQLVLDNGVVQGYRIMPQTWVADSRAPIFSLEHQERLVRWDSLRISAYGYSWWLDNEGGMWALGHCGQRIYINCLERLAVVQLAAYPHPFFETSHYGDMDARLRQFIDDTRKMLGQKKG